MKTPVTHAAIRAAAAFANAPKAAAAAANTAAAASGDKRIAPEISGVFSIKLPEKKTSNRGSKSPYPFDTLEVGQAFGVKNKTAKQLSSIVSNQNRKDANFRPVKDDAGNVVYKMNDLRGPDGSITKVPTKEPEMEQIKEFVAYDVDAELAKQIKGTPLDGSSVLVYRMK